MVKVKKVKNVSGAESTWLGQTIANTAEYTLQRGEEEKWALAATDELSKVYLDIQAGNLQVGDQDAYMVTARAALKYLKDANYVDYNEVWKISNINYKKGESKANKADLKNIQRSLESKASKKEVEDLRKYQDSKKQEPLPTRDLEKKLESKASKKEVEDLRKYLDSKLKKKDSSKYLEQQLENKSSKKDVENLRKYVDSKDQKQKVYTDLEKQLHNKASKKEVSKLKDYKKEIEDLRSQIIIFNKLLDTKTTKKDFDSFYKDYNKRILDQHQLDFIINCICRLSERVDALWEGVYKVCDKLDIDNQVDDDYKLKFNEKAF